MNALEFPGAWQNYPVEVRRYLLARVMEKQIGIQGGPAGVIEWLYRGTRRRPEEIGTDVARGDTCEIRYDVRAHQVWPLVVADARAWTAARTKEGI